MTFMKLDDESITDSVWHCSWSWIHVSAYNQFDDSWTYRSDLLTIDLNFLQHVRRNVTDEFEMSSPAGIRPSTTPPTPPNSPTNFSAGKSSSYTVVLFRFPISFLHSSKPLTSSSCMWHCNCLLNLKFQRMWQMQPQVSLLREVQLDHLMLSSDWLRLMQHRNIHWNVLHQPNEFAKREVRTGVRKKCLLWLMQKNRYKTMKKTALTNDIWCSRSPRSGNA